MEEEELQKMIQSCVDTKSEEEIPSDNREKLEDYEAKFEVNSDLMKAVFGNPSEEDDSKKDIWGTRTTSYSSELDLKSISKKITEQIMKSIKINITIIIDDSQQDTETLDIDKDTPNTDSEGTDSDSDTSLK